MGPQESRVSYISPNRMPRSEHDMPSPDTLEREVRHRRHNIDDLLGELTSLVHPKTLMRQAVDWVRSGDNRQGVKDKAAGASESLKASGREVGRKISDKITSLTHDAKVASREMLDKRRTQTQTGLHHAKEGAKREMGHVKERAVATALDNPMVVALGFLGAGLMAGMMAPRSKAERDVARKANDVFAKGAFQEEGGTTMTGRSEVASA